jgi:pantothenate kinase-related protein Tda10
MDFPNGFYDNEDHSALIDEEECSERVQIIDYEERFMYVSSLHQCPLFPQTIATDRQMLGDEINQWVNPNDDCRIVSILGSQSSGKSEFFFAVALWCSMSPFRRYTSKLSLRHQI